ncbi:MAG: UDP-N-acetylmuramoyl-L-alanine--D-glutamate ligase [Actinomycetia bacterium]|nr:UDP-N-acetylmuramoyl-L-alanine--D-glutamate ligase [Actinomycetes bacterium]
MRPTFGWSDLVRHDRVGLWGLGVEGAANLRRLRSLGIEPIQVDDRPAAEDVTATDAGGLELLATCDVVVKTPGISRYRQDVQDLEASGIPVVGGMGLWLHDVDRERVICVTGTKGKSTTVSIAGHLANGLGVRCFVGGNLGVAPYDPGAGDDHDLWVIEVSSYQATDVAVAPPVVGVTSLHADHLDWHGGLDTYYSDKLSITRQPGVRVAVCGEDEELRGHASLIGGTVRWVGADQAVPWWQHLGLVGQHNATNAAIAAALLAEAGVEGASEPDALAAAAEGYRNLSSRLQHVATVQGVEFYDDSLSTNVLPTIAAVAAFPGRRVALILGGFDRGIDYHPLAHALAGRQEPTLALTLPSSGERIAAAIDATAAEHLELVRCDDLDAAVTRGFAWAAPDGVVLLSPAAPSFGTYRNYRERAEAFTRLALECGP